MIDTTVSFKKLNTEKEYESLFVNAPEFCGKHLPIEKFGLKYYLIFDTRNKKYYAYFNRRRGWMSHLFNYSPEFTTLKQAEKHLEKEIKRIIKLLKKNIKEIEREI